MRTDYYLYAVAFMVMALLGCDQIIHPETEDLNERGCKEVEFLISSAQLHTYLKEGIDLSLIEVSPVDQFQQGHIPGAQSLWRPDYTDASYPYGEE
ncbi:MAG: hypothetical protein AAGC85_03240 [Bacteroidota bacterium]